MSAVLEQRVRAANTNVVAAALQRLRAFVVNAYAAWRRDSHARAVYASLQSLDASTLRDLGFVRSELGSVAAELSGQAELTRVRSIKARSRD